MHSNELPTPLRTRLRIDGRLPVLVLASCSLLLLLPLSAVAAETGSGDGEAVTPPSSETTTTTTQTGETPAPVPPVGAAPGETTVSPPGEAPAKAPREPRVPREPRAPRERATRSAERREAHSGCRLKFVLVPRRLTAGEAIVVSGTLACALQADAAEQTITVYQHLPGSPGYSPIGTASTGEDGAFELEGEAQDTNSFIYAATRGVRSSRRALKVAPLVSIAGPAQDTPLVIPSKRARTSAAGTSTVTFTGQVSPNDAGARVVLQRAGEANGDWRRIGFGEVGDGGSYAIAHTFHKPGSAIVRVVVRARGHNLPGVSEALSYVIAPRQNPLLTIQASANPLSYGEAPTISGLATGAANDQVTLLARQRGGAFTELAKTTTDGDGNYAFAAQSPTQTTYYRVDSSHQHSTVLPERVRPLLTAEVSAASVQAGQALTFSGTITPGHAGQAFYLERQNASGVGFHTVETGALGEGSSYSIAHTPFTAGSHVFRVKFPGAEGAQAVASELFTVQVQDAGAAALQAAAAHAAA